MLADAEFVDEGEEGGVDDEVEDDEETVRKFGGYMLLAPGCEAEPIFDDDPGIWIGAEE